MKDEVNSQKNEEKKRTISKNKLKKYITVQRIKTKNKNLLLFTDKDKENIENINNLNNYLTNQINNEIYKTKKDIKNYSNSNKAFNHFLKSSNNKNINNNNNYKKTSIFIIPNEYDNYNNNKKLRNKNSKKNIFPISHKTNATLEKEENRIRQTNSYFSPKIKSRLKMNNVNNTNNLSKSKSKIKTTVNNTNTNKISKTYSSNEIKSNKKANINNILDNNTHNDKNKTRSIQRITKDTIFEKENINPNLYNTISTNIKGDYNKNINNINNKINNIIIKDKNINKRNKNVRYTNANTNETMNTILIKKNNSELLTFGNTNNDSLSESFSKDENINKNFLLILKQENESLKNELKKTKEKVDVLENKIESLICEKNFKNKNINKLNDNNNINDDGNLNKKSITINKEKIKYSKSQRDFKINKNNGNNNNHKKIKVKNIQRENSIKTKIINHASSSGFGGVKYKQKIE